MNFNTGLSDLTTEPARCNNCGAPEFAVIHRAGLESRYLCLNMRDMIPIYAAKT